MVQELTELLDKFPGAANQTWCFVHTLSISPKSVLKQFNVPKKKDGEIFDEAAQALADLAKEIGYEEWVECETQESEDDKEENHPLNAWADFQDGMTEQEKMDLKLSVQPVRSMLVKVSLLISTLTPHCWHNLLSYASSLSLSRTQLQSSSQHGMAHSRPTTSLAVWCLITSLLTGTLLMTCWILPSTIGKPLMPWLLSVSLTSESTSWELPSGELQVSSEMCSRCMILSHLLTICLIFHH